jgi:uncharacterized protein (DUF169 family)
MEIFKEFKEVIDEQLHLASLPIAIKFIKREQDIPKEIGRPMRDLGGPIRPCTGYHLVRHQGLSLAMLEEDFSIACPAGLFIFGIFEPIKPWIEGELAYEIYTGTREAAANMERSVFRLETGKFKGMALAPLAKANFIPDLIMVYCDSKQAMRLVTAATFTDGEPLRFSMAARGLCSDGVVQPFQIKRPVVSIPCGGDRLFGVAQDNEVVFTTPLDRLEGIVKGLRAFESSHRIEHLGGESELRKRYNEMAKILEEKLGRSNSQKNREDRNEPVNLGSPFEEL